MGGDAGQFDLATGREVLESASAVLSRLDEVVFEVPGAELGSLLGLVDRVVAMGELARVTVTAEALERGEIGVRGAPLSPAQWVLAHAPSTRSGGAGAVVSLAADFAKLANAPVRAAVLSGRIGVRSAATVVSEADKLRPLLVEGAEAPVLEGLVAMAERHGPRGCRLVRPRLLAQYGHDDVLQRDQDAAKRFISLSQPREAGSGIFEYALTLDPEGMCALEAAIGPMAAPKPSAGERDLRGSDRRRGDALVQLIRRAVASTEVGAGTSKAQLFVTMDYARLGSMLAAATGGTATGGTATGGTATGGTAGTGNAEGRRPLAAGEVVGGTQAGTLLAPETVRRLACDATLIPLVLGVDREILDWGRAKRLFTPAQTKRLWLRDGGCTYPGCDAPPQWCDAHHLVHWADGGSTDLANAGLLCDRHHQLVHRRRLAGTLGPDPEDKIRWDLTLGSYDDVRARGATEEPA
jgi:hypothetical protein